MRIRINSTGAVMFEDELRSYLKSINGPTYDQLTPEVMEALGVDPVLEGPQATLTDQYSFSQYAGVEQIDGMWFTKYIAGPIFYDTPDKTAEEQEADYKAAKDAEQSKAVRADRNNRLADSDWTQVADALVDKEAWATYRKALRNVPSQKGFPWTINWPVYPNS
jgi:hypothetical protein